MVDIATDFGSLDDNWHYLALTEDVRAGVQLVLGARLTAGSGNDIWTVEITSIDDGLVRFKLIEPLDARVTAIGVGQGPGDVAADIDRHLGETGFGR